MRFFMLLLLTAAITHAALAQAIAVIGCGIEIAAAICPGGVDGFGTIAIADRCQQIPQGRTAATQRRDPQCGLAHLALIHPFDPVLLY